VKRGISARDAPQQDYPSRYCRDGEHDQEFKRTIPVIGRKPGQLFNPIHADLLNLLKRLRFPRRTRR